MKTKSDFIFNFFLISNKINFSTDINNHIVLKYFDNNLFHLQKKINRRIDKKIK